MATTELYDMAQKIFDDPWNETGHDIEIVPKTPFEYYKDQYAQGIIDTIKYLNNDGPCPLKVDKE